MTYDQKDIPGGGIEITIIVSVEELVIPELSPNVLMQIVQPMLQSKVSAKLIALASLAHTLEGKQ
jgi:hypothetical protein